MPRCTSCMTPIFPGGARIQNGCFWCRTCFDAVYCVCRVCDRVFFRLQRFSDDCLCAPCRSRLDATWQPSQFLARNTTFNSVESTRPFGIELETSRCPDYRLLHDNTIFGAKQDGSISGMEFISPILYGDAGLTAIIDFCTKAKAMKFTVNSDCGYHLHIDMRGTLPDQRRSTAYAYYLTYPVWQTFVNQYRAYDCSYCRSPDYTATELLRCANFDRWAESQSRYQFINLQAYACHNTFEIRGYEGTLNANEICNWIKAHLKFADFVENETPSDLFDLFNGRHAKTWAAMRKILGPDLARVYGRKRATRNTPIFA